MKVKRITFNGLGKKNIIVTTNYQKMNAIGEAVVKGADNDLIVEVKKNGVVTNEIPFSSFNEVSFIR